MSTRSSVQTGCAIVAAVLAAPLAAAPAVAGDDVTAGRIADVVITAERRPDTVQAVPIAVTALPADTISARNLATPLLIANSVPNMFASNAVGLGSANTYTLRGLGQDETAATFSPAVATFIDDIYFGRTNGSNFRFFDIERAEVLRGPQGTLHGRNTIGGAIRIVNNRPSETLGGFGEVAYGAFDRKLARGSLDIPANAAIQVKLSGYFLDDDGYVQNTTTGETLNDSDAAGLRGAVQLKITDTLRWNVAATYMRNDGENLPNLVCDPNAPAVCDGRYSGTSARKDPVLPTGAPAGTSIMRALGNRLDTQMYTSHLEWVGDNFALSAITGFLNTSERSTLDLNSGLSRSPESPFPPVNIKVGLGASLATNDGASDQFSQELKLAGTLLSGRVDVVAGLLYTDEDNVGDDGNATVRNGTTNKAAYVQVDVNATPRLKVTAGVRFTDEQTQFDIADNRIGPGSSCLSRSCLDTTNLLTAPGGTPIPTTTTAKFWTPRFGISYRAGDAVLLYASAARGYRSGGWDARSRRVEYIRPFAAETGWSYEGGIKADAFDGRLRANLVGFWLEARNSQALRMASSRDFFSGESLQNIDGFRNRGLELELQAAPIQGLMLSASLGYQQARYKVSDSLAPNAFGLKSIAQQQFDCRAQLAKRLVPFSTGYALIAGQPIIPPIASQTNAVDCANGIVDANGNIATPPRAPDFSVAVGGSYDWPIPAAGIILTPSVNAVYRSAYEAGTANATLFTGSVTGVFNRVMPANPFAGEIISGSRNPAVWQVAAALTLRTDDNNWTLALECENCLDTVFTQTSVDLVSYYNPPRVWQIRARRAF